MPTTTPESFTLVPLSEVESALGDRLQIASEPISSQTLTPNPVIEKIKSFEMFSEAGLGEDNQENIKDTVIETKELVAFAAIREISGVKERQPPLAEKVDIKLTQERGRVEKRNVLPDYDVSLETWKAEVIETTATRFMTHEPCVEHNPVTFEKDIDPEEVLQTLFREKNPENENYLQYRNGEVSVRYI